MDELLKRYLPTKVRGEETFNKSADAEKCTEIKGSVRYPYRVAKEGWQHSYYYEKMPDKQDENIFIQTTKRHLFYYRPQGDFYEVVYAHTYNEYRRSQKYLAVGGPLQGQTLSTTQMQSNELNNFYCSYNNAGWAKDKSKAMIWVHNSLLNDKST